MKTLYVLRHGHAVPEAQAATDYERQLTLRGEGEARQSAQWLVGRERLPSLVISSSATRARQTADLFLARLPRATELQVLEDLYLAEPPSYLAALAAGADPHGIVMVVGHNPGLEALVYGLTNRSEHLATASLVEIELPVAAWSELSSGVRGFGRFVDAFPAR